jgi:hypothetical protein
MHGRAEQETPKNSTLIQKEKQETSWLSFTGVTGWSGSVLGEIEIQAGKKRHGRGNELMEGLHTRRSTARPAGSLPGGGGDAGGGEIEKGGAIRTLSSSTPLLALSPEGIRGPERGVMRRPDRASPLSSTPSAHEHIVCAPSEQLPATCLLGLARATTKQMLNPNTSLQLHGSQVIRFRIHQSWTPGVFFEQKKTCIKRVFPFIQKSGRSAVYFVTKS